MKYKPIVLSEQAIKALQGDHWNTTQNDQEEIESALRRFEDDRILEANRVQDVPENRPKDNYLNMI